MDYWHIFCGIWFIGFGLFFTYKREISVSVQGWGLELFKIRGKFAIFVGLSITVIGAFVVFVNITPNIDVRVDERFIGFSIWLLVISFMIKGRKKIWNYIKKFNGI